MSAVMRSSATLIRGGLRHYWRGAIRTDRDTVVWECDHEHTERGADRLDYYGRSFGAMLCAAQEIRRRAVAQNLARAEGYLHAVIDNPRLLDRIEDGDTIAFGDDD